MTINSKKLRKIKSPYKHQGGYTLEYNCHKCNKIIYIQKHKLKKHTGLCRMCLLRKKPYEHLYTALKRHAKNRFKKIELTYNQFIKYTSIKNCHYCYDLITWTKHVIRNKKQTLAYNLDRKNTNKNYSKNNCVVCCYDCNWMKGCKFTYEEFMLLSPGLKKIKRNRNAKHV